MNSSHLLKEFLEGMMSFGVSELKRELEVAARAKMLSAALHGVRGLKTACQILVTMVSLAVICSYSGFSLIERYFIIGSGINLMSSNQPILFFYSGCFVISLVTFIYIFREKFWLKLFKVNDYIESMNRVSLANHQKSQQSIDNEALILAIDRIVEARITERLQEHELKRESKRSVESAEENITPFARNH